MGRYEGGLVRYDPATDRPRGEGEVVMDNIAKTLKTLQNLTNGAVDTARLPSNDFAGESINWGDLSCVEATYCINQEGHQSYRVFIEEADPSCPKFQNFVRDYLYERGFKSVEVRTEW